MLELPEVQAPPADPDTDEAAKAGWAETIRASAAAETAKAFSLLFSSGFPPGYKE